MILVTMYWDLTKSQALGYMLHKRFLKYTFPFGVILDLLRSWQDRTDSLNTVHPDSLKGTFYATMMHFSKPRVQQLHITTKSAKDCICIPPAFTSILPSQEPFRASSILLIPLLYPDTVSCPAYHHSQLTGQEKLRSWLPKGTLAGTATDLDVSDSRGQAPATPSPHLWHRGVRSCRSLQKAPETPQTLHRGCEVEEGRRWYLCKVPLYSKTTAD